MRGAVVAKSFACCVVLALSTHSLAADDPPRIHSSQRFVFVGQSLCVCGHFPTPASRQGLMIGGVAVGEPLSASPSMLEVGIPAGVLSGRHLISGLPSSGFEEESVVEVEVLELAGSIDRDLLRSGQATPMRIRIHGTEEPLELKLVNETPQIISIEGGEEGVVRTSGGIENTVQRTVRGIRPGDFNISYEVADDPCPCESAVPSESAGDGAGAGVVTGYPLPADVRVLSAVGTGRTTGHIADLTVTNGGGAPIRIPDRPLFIPSRGGFQSYVALPGGGTEVAPGETRTVPIAGYCTDVRRPPVPAGQALPGPEDWIVPSDPTQPTPVAPHPGEEIDPNTRPADAAPHFWGALEAIESAVADLQANGDLKTPFSGDRAREREAVVQQTLWRFSGELSGVPYAREDFEERLQEQYENRTGIDIEAAPEGDRERLRQGADDFWDAFTLIGVEAKVMTVDEDVPEEVEDEEAPVETVEPPCEIDKSMDHSEPGSSFKMSESYKDEDKRANLKEWFSELPDVSSAAEGGTFEAGTHPASAWALAGRDFVGGYCNGVAKHVFLEAGGGQDWVWSTELLEVEARSTGTHTLTVTPPLGGNCETLVVGGGGGVVEAWTNAVDPIANSRDFLTVLRVVRDVSIIVASVVLAPVTAGASIAVGVATLGATMAFDAEFTSDADAAAAVEGRMKVVVKRRELRLDANSRSTVSGDGTIDSDGAKVATGQTSAFDPTTLTVTTEGFSTLKTRAEDNGIAEGTIESQIGLAIVGFCYCDGAIQIEYLLDSGLFLAEEGAAGAATAARVRLERLLNSVLDRYAQMEPGEVIPTARENLPDELEQMLEEWYSDIPGRFNLPGE